MMNHAAVRMSDREIQGSTWWMWCCDGSDMSCTTNRSDEFGFI